MHYANVQLHFVNRLQFAFVFLQGANFFFESSLFSFRPLFDNFWIETGPLFLRRQFPDRKFVNEKNFKNLESGITFDSYDI